ncbi:MAG: hypothetical protein NDJ89_14335 [Oligoflexia bacterium]|nr:hypothetical protein [Oligoflexia bacterium]
MRGTHQPPLELIRFMAKTGFISHDLWRRYFCTAQSSSWARRMKNGLIRRGYLKLHSSKYHGALYLLDRESPVVRAMNLNPVAPPPVGQIDHDEILAEGILSLERSGLVSFWQSESELKKLGANDYRLETQGQLIKYPDLLIYASAPLPERIMAVELERTLKTRRRYVQLLGAYASMKRINGLIYVVENPSIKRTIQEVMKEVYFPVNRLPVSFFTQDEWLSDAAAVLAKAAGPAPAAAKIAS